MTHTHTHAAGKGGRRRRARPGLGTHTGARTTRTLARARPPARPRNNIFARKHSPALPCDPPTQRTPSHFSLSSPPSPIHHYHHARKEEYKMTATGWCVRGCCATTPRLISPPKTHKKKKSSGRIRHAIEGARRHRQLPADARQRAQPPSPLTIAHGPFARVRWVGADEVKHGLSAALGGGPHAHRRASQDCLPVCRCCVCRIVDDHRSDSRNGGNLAPKPKPCRMRGFHETVAIWKREKQHLAATPRASRSLFSFPTQRAHAERAPSVRRASHRA
jgi:hypothetical protein